MSDPHASLRAMLKRALTLALVTACATRLPPPDRPGAADAYRAELARGPKVEKVRKLKEALESAEFEAARRAHTILGWHRFLKEFPDGIHRHDARARLESLRWAEAERLGTEPALAGFLADEPSGAHAAEAWEKLAAVRLAAALASRDEAALRAWIAGHPQAAGNEKARAALDEAQFAAAGRDGKKLRAYLAEHPEGRHRSEARSALERHGVAEAELLDDDVALDALARDGVAGAAEAAARVRAGRAAARIEGRAGLAADARLLYLPRATADELPQEPLARARALRRWATALDGTRLARLLAEVGSRHAWVAVEALRATERLLSGLPAAEARARAERLASTLAPVAMAAPQLVQLSLLEHAAGRPAEALARARAAAARDPAGLVGAWRAADAEARSGDAAMAALAVEALAIQAKAHAEAHAGVERDPVALLETCAAAQAARRAEQIAGASRARARSLAAAIEARLDEAERGAPPAARCAALREEGEAEQAAAAGERRAAARRLARVPALARAALDRARARDPDPEVRAAAAAALQAAR